MITMILENKIEKIKFYDKAGVSRIFIDLEILWKQERQGHLDTVISNHKISDISVAKNIITNAEVLTRINPINENTHREINEVINAGADIIMLPMFKTANEVDFFLRSVNKRVKTCLLLETSEALCRIDDILELDGIDEIHIGLNDLHLSLGLTFIFELLTNGIVEYLTKKIKLKNIPFGIGGIARMHDGTKFSGLPVLIEHVRLGSSMVILSRRFKEYAIQKPELFYKEIKDIQIEEEKAKKLTNNQLNSNHLLLKKLIAEVVEDIERTENV